MGSWIGSVFKIEYFLKVFVKFNAWNSRGEGDLTILPIKILTTPKLIVSEENYRVP